MASYNELNALIDAYINRNGVQAITGQILNGVLKAMVEQLGRGYTIMGAATPTTDPGTPDGPECYFASETGTYTDFDGLQVVPGELALLCYTPTDGWTKATIYEGFREVGATIDGNVGIPSVGVSYADGVLSFDFHNMKGNTGQNGQDGAAAGFGTIGADITGGVGTPAVTVESSGPANAKNLQFHFTNLKGETGVTSVVATVDNTTGTPACTVSLVGQQLTLAFSGLKGLKGDTGVSANYPITIYNGLDSDATDAALAAAQGKVLDGKITELEAKVTDLEGAFDIEHIVSPNLLDMSKCVPGYYWTNGHNDSASYQYTDYIPVEEGETYTLQSSAGGTRSLQVMRFIVFFDESKTMLESGHISSSPTSVVIPEAAAYMIVSFAISITISNSPAIVKSSQVIPYVAYFDPYNDLHLKPETLGDGIIQEQMLGNGAVGGNKVKTDAISFDKVSFKQSKNLLNKEDPDVMLGYSQYGPTPIANSNYNLTGYIPVEAGVPYTFSYMGTGNKRAGTNIRFISYFSEEKVYLSHEGLKITFTPPVNAKYARLSIVTYAWNTGQVERGRYIGNYFPYSPQIEASLIPTYTPTFILPRKVYILDGYENNIYFKNVFNFLNPLFLVNVSSRGWEQRERCVRAISTEAPCEFQLVKNDGTFKIFTRDQFATVKGLPSTNNGPLAVNCIGDSFTYNGGWFNQMNVLCPSLSFVGMRKSYSTDESLRAEGRGGWTLQSYMERAKGTQWYDGFSPFIHPDGYKYYGICEFWAAIVNGTIGSHTYELNGFDDFASWFGTDGKKLNPSENDMMYDATNSKYIYWNGSAWADYSGTPTFVFDYAKYIDTWGITSPDVVVIMLGVNDFFSEFTEELADAWVANMNTVIQSIQTYAFANNKTIKIAICTNNTIASLPNSSYGKSPVKNSLNLWWGRRNCISAFDKQPMEDASVYVVDTAAVFDPDYGFQTREDKPFAYYEGERRELYDTNGVHPSAAGYKQLGQCVAAWLQAVR